MNDILQNLTPENLVQAIEENLSSWIPELGKTGRYTYNEPPGVSRSISPLLSSLFNSIMDANLPPDKVDETIQLLVADARQRNVPILWWIGPSTRPQDLHTYLEKYDFHIDDDGPGMAVELKNLNEYLPIPAGLSIRAVQDDRSRWEWCKTMGAGFEIPSSSAHIVDAWHEFLDVVDKDKCQTYLAWMDGRPVATSMVFFGAGVAGIYAVATVPDARRKGIGAQVTLHPLLEARKKGYLAGILQASEMGEGVYRQLGFKEYCRIQSYRFKP